MNVPLHALVHCTDGPFGHTTCLIVNPINGIVTHFVVNDRRVLGYEHIVPVSFIISVTQDDIRVYCSRTELVHQPIFLEHQYVRLDDTLPAREDYIYWPMTLIDKTASGVSQSPSIKTLQIPVDELGIERGMGVYIAAENDDGEKTDSLYFGQVMSFVADRQTGDITHLALRKGCVGGQRDAIVPVSSIRTISSGNIYLTLTKQELEALPILPLKKVDHAPEHLDRHLFASV
jgi:hypothetical protein